MIGVDARLHDDADADRRHALGRRDLDGAHRGERAGVDVLGARCALAYALSIYCLITEPDLAEDQGLLNWRLKKGDLGAIKELNSQLQS